MGEQLPVMNPRVNLVPQVVPGNCAGPKVMTFLPKNLPDQLQAIIHLSSLHPHAAQGGRLIKELLVLTRYLELLVSLITLEGETLLAEMCQGCKACLLVNPLEDLMGEWGR